MRDTWNELRREFKHLEGVPDKWTRNDFDLFFEVEGLLAIYELIVPDRSKRNTTHAWALVSGLKVPQIVAEDIEPEVSVLNGRENLLYVKSKSAWSFWLNWYRGQPASLRLYDFIGKKDYGQRSGVPLRAERLAAYRQLLLPPAKPKVKSMPELAIGSRFYFEAEGVQHHVDIPTDFPVQTASMPHSVTHRGQRPVAITVDLDLLQVTAEELDQKEHRLNIDPLNGWQQRLEPLALVLRETNQHSRTLTIDGLSHVVGALGAGKSTLIWLLIYYLATVENRHVSVVMNTVVEAFQLSRWLRLMGVTAAPALGRNRSEHARRVGYAFSDVFHPDRVFSSLDTDDPLFRWLPKPCTLAALAEVQIPFGQEPCWHLRDEGGSTHTCPLLGQCPVHQMQRDLNDGMVWVLNPSSFLYSLAPASDDGQVRHFFEAVYHRSDLLVIDEADRVQANWDHAFAPTTLVLGTNDAQFDWLHGKLTDMTSGVGRIHAARSDLNTITRIDDQINMLSNHVYGLLTEGSQRGLFKWVKDRQLTNRRLFQRLAADMKRSLSQNMPADERKRRLDELNAAFRAYWPSPQKRESGFLAVWLNRLLGGDESSRRLRGELDRWLMERMGWEDVRTADHRLSCRKLELAIMMTALIKRMNDMQRHLPWVENRLNERSPQFGPVISERLLTAMPDPPVGVILGLHVSQDSKSGQIVVRSIRYRGVGRWLLLNYHRLFAERTGTRGPHMLLTSATSWLPGAVGSHIAQPPQALLIRQADEDRVPDIKIRYQPVLHDGVPLRVSGAAHDKKEQNLRQMVRALASGDPSDLQRELDHWHAKGTLRRVLIVVNSYEQVQWAWDELERIQVWQGRVLRLFPDDQDLTHGGIRTRKVETFYQHDADVLIAPMMAIQRGFNILDEWDNALLGTAFFLVRPFPTPFDLTPHVMSLNAWFMNHLSDNGRRVDGETLVAIVTLRQQALRQWHRRLQHKGTLVAMDDWQYQEYLRDQFVMVLQTIGRMIRRGQPARTILVDGAFKGGKSQRDMLEDWHAMLQSLFDTEDSFDRRLTVALYGAVWRALNEAMEQRRI